MPLYSFVPYGPDRPRTLEAVRLSDDLAALRHADYVLNASLSATWVAVLEDHRAVGLARAGRPLSLAHPEHHLFFSYARAIRARARAGQAAFWQLREHSIVEASKRRIRRSRALLAEVERVERAHWRATVPAANGGFDGVRAPDRPLAAQHVRDGQAPVRSLEQAIEWFLLLGHDGGLPASALELFKELLASLREPDTAIREGTRADQPA